MSVEISAYIDVKKRIADLGLNQPDALAILPRNFDCATSMLSGRIRPRPIPKCPVAGERAVFDVRLLFPCLPSVFLMCSDPICREPILMQPDDRFARCMVSNRRSAAACERGTHRLPSHSQSRRTWRRDPASAGSSRVLLR